MPSVHIIRKSEIADSFRVQQIRGMFDYQRENIVHEWKSVLPIEEKSWSVGLIVGPSGAGKTTLASEAFPLFSFHSGFEWDPKKAVVDGFLDNIDTKAIVAMFNAVGFSSPPHWLKPFHHLSNGQKFRVELARCLIENKTGLIFDEFTSVVDRDVAKIGCAAISKALRRKDGPPFIAVSCHYDIIDWLEPDWVFDVGSQSFEWRSRRRFPEIVLRVYKTNTSTWNFFREYHYLDHTISQAAQCFVATWNEKPIAFTSVVHFPHPSCATFKREHRTVVLPDFQGVGIGNRFSEFVASYYKKQGFRFISTTSSPAMIQHRAKSKLWKTHRFGYINVPGKSALKSISKTLSAKRITAGFEFIGNG
jgi:ABC-type polar amino acid transport system ATPase subunit/GNAT superfamily N-acetyltransferase